MQGSQKDSGELDIIWIVVGVLLLAGLLFFLFRDYILAAILWIKHGELDIISYFMHDDHYAGLETWTKYANVKSVKFAQLRLLSLEVGLTLQWPCILFLLGFAIFIYFKHPDTGYRDIESMNSLSAKVRKVFPAINVVQGLDLIKESMDEGPWATAETPIEFAKKYKLIYRDKQTDKIILDKNKAKLVFSQQLGEPFKGVEKLKPHQQALFAIFAAFANYKREEAEAKMEEIVAHLTPEQVKTGKIKFNTDALLQKYHKTPVVQKIVKHSAFTNTIFMELLTEARKTGIVLNSLFLWLKPIDRKLWYVLNNVGRKAVFIEGAAVQAHWLSERRLGFSISQPMVDEAIAALEEAIASRVIKDI